MRRVRLGVIGSGLAVRVLHWPALQRLHEQFEVVALCDISDAEASQTAALVGLDRWTSNYREILADERVEAVLLSLPIHLNAELTMAAARAGKHVICEKPLAATLEQGRELVAALKHLPVIVEIAENMHYRDDIRQARAWIDGGRIGQLVAIIISARFWTDHTSGFGATPWRQDAQYRGAVITDACVHHAAILRALGGEIEQLHAFVKDVHPVMPGYDTMMLNVRFRNGALGQICFAGAAKGVDGHFAQVSVLGTEGAITIDEGTATLRGPSGDPEVFTAPDYDNGYTPEFRNFYDAIVHGAPVVATPEEALRDLTIIMRAFDSAESRSVVLL